MYVDLARAHPANRTMVPHVQYRPNSEKGAPSLLVSKPGRYTSP
jgi:hypothetical protein